MRPLLLGPLLLLTACSGNDVTETLGLGRHAPPDEFEVVSRPPLTVPKEFFLRPPEDGSTPPLGGTTAPQSARRMVTGLEAGTSDMTLDQAEAGRAVDTAAPVVQSGELSSSGEESLLKRVGATQADPKIRSELSADRSAQAEAEDDESFLDRLRGKTSAQPTVDAKGEAERIKAAKADGKPVNDGETAVVDPSKRSVLDRIFD